MRIDGLTVRGPFLVGLLLLALSLSSRDTLGAEPNCSAPADARTVASVSTLIDTSAWRICAVLPTPFGAAMPDAVAVLLRSTAPKGTSGAGDPLFGVDLLIANHGAAVYRFTDYADRWKYFIDDDLRIQDLTANGTPAVIFHSGEVGVSDQWVKMHVVLVPPGETFATDVANDEIGDSWRHRTRWIDVHGAPAVLVAKPVDPAASNDPHMCHSCPKYYQYLVYQWSASRSSFLLIRAIQSERDIDAETNPLDADKELIQRALAN